MASAWRARHAAAFARFSGSRSLSKAQTTQQPFEVSRLAMWPFLQGWPVKDVRRASPPCVHPRLASEERYSCMATRGAMALRRTIALLTSRHSHAVPSATPAVADAADVQRRGRAILEQPKRWRLAEWRITPQTGEAEGQGLVVVAAA